jgi:ribosomal protein S9
MTQKRFKKLLMAHDVSANCARGLVEYMKALRQSIEQGDDLVVLADAKTAETMEFKAARVYPYAETYKRILEGRDFLV